MKLTAHSVLLSIGGATCADSHIAESSFSVRAGVFSVTARAESNYEAPALQHPLPRLAGGLGRALGCCCNCARSCHVSILQLRPAKLAQPEPEFRITAGTPNI